MHVHNVLLLALLGASAGVPNNKQQQRQRQDGTTAQHPNNIMFAVHSPAEGAGHLIRHELVGMAPLQYILVITNQGDTPLKGAKVWYTGETYSSQKYVSVPTIAPGKTRKAEFVLEADHFVGISQVPIGLSFKLTAADGSVLNEYAFRVDFSWFTSVLKPPTFDPKVYDLPLFNVLLFGLAGAGKSSFINSVMRYTQSSRSETGRASEPVSGGGDHCTVTLRSVEGSGLPLALWDTWGLTPKTYRGNELEMLMKGKLPSEWHKDDDVSLATTDESVEYENMPHALLFLLPQGMLHDTDGEIMQDIKTRFLNIVREGINPIVVITKLDEAEPQLKQDWSC